MKPAEMPKGWQVATESDLQGLHASIRFTPKIGQVIRIPEHATVWKRPILEADGKTVRKRKNGTEIFAFYIVCVIDDCEKPIPMGAFNSIPEERADFASKSDLNRELVDATDDEARYRYLCGKSVKAVGFFEGHGPDFSAQPGDNGRFPLKETKFTIWDLA
jgi:hypothetical protein